MCLATSDKLYHERRIALHDENNYVIINKYSSRSLIKRTLAYNDEVFTRVANHLPEPYEEHKYRSFTTQPNNALQATPLARP
jgi:hypothetical protein